MVSDFEGKRGTGTYQNSQVLPRPANQFPQYSRAEAGISPRMSKISIGKGPYLCFILPNRPNTVPQARKNLIITALL